MSTKPSTIQIDIPITPAPSPSSSPSRTTARSRTSLTIPSTSDDITRGSKTSDMQTTKNKGPPLPNPPSPEIASLAQLLTDMKKASKGFANVLGSFETGAAKVANVGANVKASEEIERLRKAHEQQVASHTSDIERVQQQLRERVKTAVKDRLRPFVLDQVRKSVASQVKTKVEQQLRQRLSDRLREDAIAHREHMQEIQVQLHNMEARRVNGMLSKAEQLKPLLRLPSPSASTPLSARTPAVLASPDDVLPSPKFPRSVEACRSLSDADVKELAMYYGFWEDRSKPYEKVASSVRKKMNGPPREEVLNLLLEYIGAPGFHFLRIVPTSSSSSPVGSKEPRVLLLQKATV